MTSRIFLLLLLFLPCLCWANMASPIEEGSIDGSPFINLHVDILAEKIRMEVSENFEEVIYQIDYIISTDTAGLQIPLLFLAQDFKKDFRIQVDGQAVSLRDIPPEYLNFNTSDKLKGFDYFLEDDQQVSIMWTESQGQMWSLGDLKYFEIDLLPGQHQIKVEYTGQVWVDLTDWIKEYHFRYSLSPAKYWKGFGKLEVEVDATQFLGKTFTNLGEPHSGELDKIASWNFQELPGKILRLGYIPEVSGFAVFLIWLGPIGITILIAFILVVLHLWSIKKYRTRIHTGKSPVALLGGLLMPLLFVSIYMFSYVWIDYFIGEEASGYHGYIFFVYMLYPVILIAYLPFVLFYDKNIKNRLLDSP